MADQDTLKVHSIRVAHQVQPTSTGLKVQKTLSYNVGAHGPFHHTYEPNEGTADKMKSDIGAQVAELKSVHELEQ